MQLKARSALGADRPVDPLRGAALRALVERCDGSTHPPSMHPFDRKARRGVGELHLVGFTDAPGAVLTNAGIAGRADDFERAVLAGERLQETVTEDAASEAIGAPEFVLVEATSIA